MPTHLAVFIATVAVLAMLPGANNGAITRQTLLHGRRAGLLAVAGSATGILIWAVTAAVGLSAVLLANPHAYLTIRVAGGVLLAGMGLHTLLARDRGAAREPRGRSYAAGLATALGNPKAGVFAISFLPQFVTADGPVLLSSVLLGLLWSAVSGTWFCLYVVALHKAGASRLFTARIIRTATGVTMLGLGVAVGW